MKIKRKPPFLRLRCPPSVLFAVGALLLVGSLLYAAEPASDGSIGREDPFAELPRPQVAVVEKPVLQEVGLTSSDFGRPQLFAETVSIRHLDARSLKDAIEPMGSEYGRISVDKLSNALIICDTAKKLETLLAEIAKVDVRRPGLLTETVTLRFLDPVNLKDALSNMPSQFGKISVDQSSNSLIICDTAEKLEEIVAEIKKADRRPEQIMIEVVIADVKITDDTEIGVNWENLFNTDWDGTFAQNLVTTLATAGTKGADLSIVRSNISATVHALQEVRNVEILASPRVLVLSGQEAEIRTVEEIPYEEASDTSEGGAGAITSIEFKNVGITLRVKATVAQDGQILMEVEPEQSVTTGEAGVQDVPIVDSRSARTTLLIRDGDVVVMGGLRRRETRLSTDRVPGLGHLPIIGALFSRNQETVENSELMVFISPHISKDGELTPEELERFNDLRDEPILRIPVEPLEPEILFRGSEAPWHGPAAGG